MSKTKTEEKLKNLEGMKAGIEEMVAQAWERGYKYGLYEAEQKNRRGTARMKNLEAIKPEDYRRAFTEVICGDCKYADVPRNRKPCCSCSWLERECYYEEAE